MASSCFEAVYRAHSARACRLPIKRRANSRRTVHAQASCVPRYFFYICRCHASFSVTSFAARVRTRRACVCRQGFGGAGRRARARAPPGPALSAAGLRYCLSDSAQCRLAPAPALLHVRVSSAACSARTVACCQPLLHRCAALRASSSGASAFSPPKAWPARLLHYERAPAGVDTGLLHQRLSSACSSSHWR